MSNRESYIGCFQRALSVGQSDVEELRYQEHPAWDSVGHMALIAELEDTFDIEIDMDDVIDFESFAVGVQILAKYDVVV